MIRRRSSLFGRPAAHESSPRHDLKARRRVRPGVEGLEVRLVMDAAARDLFNGLAASLQRSEAQYLKDNPAWTSTLPLVNAGLGQFRGAIQGKIDGLIAQVKSLASSATVDVGIQGLKKFGQNVRILANDQAHGTIRIATDFKFGDVNTPASNVGNFTYNFGPKALPFKFDATIAGQLGAEVALRNVDFGLSASTYRFYNSTTNPSNIALNVQAFVSPGLPLSGSFGLFRIGAKVGAFNPTGASPTGIGVRGTFASTINGDGTISSPKFDSFSAVAALDVTGSLDPSGALHAGQGQQGDTGQGLDGASLPSITTGIKLAWSSTGTTIADINFSHLKVDLGSVLSTSLAPIIQFVQRITVPIQPVLDLLTSNLPGLDDLGVDVSLLDLASVADKIGVVPPGWKELIGLATDLTSLLSQINNIKIGSGTALFDIGDFSFLANKSNNTYQLPSSLNQKNFSQIVNSLPKAARDLLQPLSDRFNALMNNGVHVNFPIVEDPLHGVVNLLTGQQAKIVTLAADYDAVGNGNQLGADAGVFSIKFDPRVEAHVHIHAGYDTQGVSDFLNNGQARSLLNGLYLETGAPLADIGGTFAVTAGASYYVLRGGISGGLDGHFRVALNNPNGSGIVRPVKDNPSRLFNVEGELAAFLKASLSLDLVVFEKEIASVDIARQTLISTSKVDPTNPFYVDNSQPPLFVVQPKQDVTIDLASPPPADPSQPDRVVVTQATFVDPKTRTNTPYIVVDVNGYVRKYPVITTNRLILNGSNRDTQYELDETAVDTILNGGKGRNSLLYDGIADHMASSGFVDHIGATGISIFQQVSGPSQGFTRNISYKNMGDVEFIAPANTNSLYIDSLPLGSLRVITAAYGGPGGKGLGGRVAGSGLHPNYIDFAGSPASNTIHVAAANLLNNHGLSIFGYSGQDSVVIEDNYAPPAIQFGGKIVPTFDIYDDAVRYSRPKAGPSVISDGGNGFGLGGKADPVYFLNQGLSLDGIEAVSITGVGSPATPVDRRFNVHSWTTSKPLSLSGSATGADTFTIGDGNLDLVSQAGGSSSAIVINGDARDTVVFDDSKHADAAYADASGNVVRSETNATSWSWNSTNTLLTRTNVSTDQAGRQMVATRGIRYSYPGTVRILGGAGADTFTYVPNSSTIKFDLAGGVGANDRLVIDNSASSARNYIIDGKGISNVAAGLTYSGFENLQLNAGKGNDLFTVNGTPAGTALTILAGDGSDSFRVDLAGLGGPLRLDGGAGYDYTDLSTSGKDPIRYGIYVDEILSSIAPEVDVPAVENLTLEGTPGDDDFEVNSTRAGTALTLAGFAGYDGYDFGARSGSLDPIQGPVVVYDMSGQGLVTFDDKASADSHNYSVGKAANGDLTFRRDGIADVNLSLYGDPHAIAFLYLDTGLAADNVSIRALPEPFLSVNNLTGGDSVVVGSDPTGRNGTLDDVKGRVDVHSTEPVRVTVDDSADPMGRDTYVENGIYGDPENVYLVGLQPSSMTFNVADGSDVQVRGGKGDDRFRVIGATAVNPISIDAGGGRDNLDYYWGDAIWHAFDQGVQVDLADHTATGLGRVEGFEDVVGTSLDDDLRGDDNANLIDGNDGNDTIIGRGGDDLLIGGYGDDTLVGGAGDDLLIGGETAYQSYWLGYYGDDVPLNPIMDEWTRSDIDQATKIAHLTGSEPGGLNKGFLLDINQVDEADQADSLTGEAGQDWFLTEFLAHIQDAEEGEPIG